MIQETVQAWPDPETVHDGYVVPHETLVKLGHGDAVAGRRLLRVLIDVETTHTKVVGPVPRPPNVRIATEADEPAILELVRLDHAENAEAVAPFDAQHVASFIQAATRERLSVIGLIDGEGGYPVGMVFLTNEVWWFSPTWYVAERLLFVHPAYRRSRHAAHLLQFAMSFVDRMSAELGYTVYLVSSVVGTKDTDRKTALFGRMMMRAGSIFVHPDPNA